MAVEDRIVAAQPLQGHGGVLLLLVPVVGEHGGQVGVVGGLHPLVVPVDGLQLLLDGHDGTMPVDGLGRQSVLGLVQPCALRHVSTSSGGREVRPPRAIGHPRTDGAVAVRSSPHLPAGGPIPRYRTPGGRYWMLMRGPAGRAVFGTACSHVYWQLPPMTRRSPRPSSWRMVGSATPRTEQEPAGRTERTPRPRSCRGTYPGRWCRRARPRCPARGGRDRARWWPVPRGTRPDSGRPTPGAYGPVRRREALRTRRRRPAGGARRPCGRTWHVARLATAPRPTSRSNSSSAPPIHASASSIHAPLPSSRRSSRGASGRGPALDPNPNSEPWSVVIAPSTLVDQVEHTVPPTPTTLEREDRRPAPTDAHRGERM